MQKRFNRPHPSLLATELPRSLLELGAFAQFVPHLCTLPRGDGHGVLVLPGFTGDDGSTRALRWFLENRGYCAKPWGLGRNLGPTDHILDGMAALMGECSPNGEKISIIGWSLGGIFARELAREHPEQVRNVITLGSPFRLSHDDHDQTNATAAYEAVAKLHSERAKSQHVPYDERPPMPVPVTNVYTRTDGVAPWQSCIDVRGHRCENIEVLGSHSGLGHNPLALMVIADRLAQPEGTWAPYRPSMCLGAAVRVGPVPESAEVAAVAA